jgi:hypothetical protein
MTVCASLATLLLAIIFAFMIAASQRSPGRQQTWTHPSTIVTPDPQQTGTVPGMADREDGVPRNSTGYGNPLWAIPLASLSATRERPIFSPSRRPPAVELASVQAKPVPVLNQPQRPHLALLGAITTGTEGIGIFRDETTKAVVRLKTGESHSGWTLRQITKREAILQKDRESLILGLPNPPTR